MCVMQSMRALPASATLKRLGNEDEACVWHSLLLFFFLLLHFPGNAVVPWLVTNIVLLLVRRQVLVFPFKGC